MGHRPEHGLNCWGWKDISVQQLFIDLCEKSWWRPSCLLPPKALPFGAVWVDALSTSARGKPVCGQTQGSGFLQQWKHKRFFKKRKKSQGLLCLVGNILVSQLQKEDQALAGSEGADGQTGSWGGALGLQRAAARLWLCYMAWHMDISSLEMALAIISPSLPGHKTYCHRQLCSLHSWFICLQPFVLSPLPSAPGSKTHLLGIALATGKVGRSTVNSQPP